MILFGFHIPIVEICILLQATEFQGFLFFSSSIPIEYAVIAPDYIRPRLIMLYMKAMIDIIFGKKGRHSFHDALIVGRKSS